MSRCRVSAVLEAVAVAAEAMTTTVKETKRGKVRRSNHATRSGIIHLPPAAVGGQRHMRREGDLCEPLRHQRALYKERRTCAIISTSIALHTKREGGLCQPLRCKI